MLTRAASTCRPSTLYEMPAPASCHSGDTAGSGRAAISGEIGAVIRRASLSQSRDVGGTQSRGPPLGDDSMGCRLRRWSLR